MHRNFTLTFLTVLLLLLGACTAEPVASEEPPVERIAYNNASIVQLRTTESMLADGIDYDVTPESELSLASGVSIGIHDIKPGDLAFISSTSVSGDDEANPTLVSITILDDDKSQRISRAVVHLMNHQEIGDIISPEIKSVNHQLVTVQFKDSSNGQLYESIVNLNTFSFHIQPIGQIQ